MTVKEKKPDKRNLDWTGISQDEIKGGYNPPPTEELSLNPPAKPPAKPPATTPAKPLKEGA